MDQKDQGVYQALRIHGCISSLWGALAVMGPKSNCRKLPLLCALLSAPQTRCLGGIAEKNADLPTPRAAYVLKGLGKKGEVLIHPQVGNSQNGINKNQFKQETNGNHTLLGSTILRNPACAFLLGKRIQHPWAICGLIIQWGMLFP